MIEASCEASDTRNMLLHSKSLLLLIRIEKSTSPIIRALPPIPDKVRLVLRMYFLSSTGMRASGMTQISPPESTNALTGKYLLESHPILIAYNSILVQSSDTRWQLMG